MVPVLLLLAAAPVTADYIYQLFLPQQITSKYEAYLSDVESFLWNQEERRLSNITYR